MAVKADRPTPKTPRSCYTRSRTTLGTRTSKRTNWGEATYLAIEGTSEKIVLILQCPYTRDRGQLAMPEAHDRPVGALQTNVAATHAAITWTVIQYWVLIQGQRFQFSVLTGHFLFLFLFLLSRKSLSRKERLLTRAEYSFLTLHLFEDEPTKSPDAISESPFASVSKRVLARSLWYGNQFCLHVNDQNLRVNETNFHMKGFALGLALKQRRNATRKSPIHMNESIALYLQ